MERVIGPIRGFYIATYACESGEANATWLGYSKICRDKPESYWDAQGCAKVRSYRSHGTPEAAMADAEREARQQTANLAPVDFSRTFFSAAVR